MSTQASRRFSPVRALRASSPALWPTRLRLASMKSVYKAGAYSGHPEDTLDSIDALEWRIRQSVNGVRPAKQTPAPESVSRAPKVVVDALLDEIDEFTARSHRAGGPFELGLEASERRLATLKAMYAGGHYRGHPEEMLEDIEVEERRAARLAATA